MISEHKHVSREYADKLTLVHLVTKLCRFLDQLSVINFKRFQIPISQPNLDQRVKFVERMQQKVKAGR